VPVSNFSFNSRGNVLGGRNIVRNWELSEGEMSRGNVLRVSYTVKAKIPALVRHFGLDISRLGYIPSGQFPLPDNFPLHLNRTFPHRLLK